MYTNEPLSLTLTRALLLAIGGAFATSMRLTIQQVTVPATVSVPTPTIRSVPLYFVVLHAKAAEQAIATEVVRKLET